MAEVRSAISERQWT